MRLSTAGVMTCGANMKRHRVVRRSLSGTSGNRAGADVPQLYLTETAGDRRVRLLGFERVQLDPRQSRQITLTVDPRLLDRRLTPRTRQCPSARA
jgi:hypothetical protein